MNFPEHNLMRRFCKELYFPQEGTGCCKTPHNPSALVPLLVLGLIDLGINVPPPPPPGPVVPFPHRTWCGAPTSKPRGLGMTASEAGRRWQWNGRHKGASWCNGEQWDTPSPPQKCNPPPVPRRSLDTKDMVLVTSCPARHCTTALKKRPRCQPGGQPSGVIG